MEEKSKRMIARIYWKQALVKQLGAFSQEAWLFSMAVNDNAISDSGGPSLRNFALAGSTGSSRVDVRLGGRRGGFRTECRRWFRRHNIPAVLELRLFELAEALGNDLP
jgi:hypothetical protein